MELAQLGVLVRGDALVLFEAADEIAAVVIATGIGHLCNGELILLQEEAGLLYSVIV